MTRSLILAVLLMAGEVCVGFIKGFAPVGAIILAIGFATAALSPSATEPVPVSAHSGDGRLSQDAVR